MIYILPILGSPEYQFKVNYTAYVSSTYGTHASDIFVTEFKIFFYEIALTAPRSSTI